MTIGPTWPFSGSATNLMTDICTTENCKRLHFYNTKLLYYKESIKL